MPPRRMAARTAPLRHHGTCHRSPTMMRALWRLSRHRRRTGQRVSGPPEVAHALPGSRAVGRAGADVSAFAGVCGDTKPMCLMCLMCPMCPNTRRAHFRRDDRDRGRGAAHGAQAQLAVRLRPPPGPSNESQAAPPAVSWTCRPAQAPAGTRRRQCPAPPAPAPDAFEHAGWLPSVASARVGGAGAGIAARRLRNPRSAVDRAPPRSGSPRRSAASAHGRASRCPRTP